MKIPNPRLPSSAHRPPSSHLPTFAPSQIRNPKSKIQNLPFPLHLHPNPLLPPASRLPPPVKLNARAFSLTEVVIALGIFAVSMVGVLALFPVASSTGRESSEETQAAILAQTVFSDLSISAGNRGATNAWLIWGKDTFGDLIQPVSLTSDNDIAIAYDVKRRDRQDSAQGAPPIGMPLALKALQEVSTAQYSSGVNDLPTATYLSLLRIRPVSGLAGLAQVTIEVSTPANVALANRRVFTFSSLITGP